MPENERAKADVKFKAISQAYEILQDDQKRHIYDTHGMAGLDPRAGMGGDMGEGVDLNDILGEMFGMGGGGMPGGRRSQRPRKGENEEHPYPVTLEDLYKGKTAKFASKKKVICPTCKGKGGKERAKPVNCASCKGQGVKIGLRPLGNGMMAQETVLCNNCKGAGNVYNEKDKCKKCKGSRTIEERKVLEIYIPRGSK